MNPVLTVEHVLTLFPHRKKSWAYRELNDLRATVGKRFVTLADLAENFEMDLEDLRARLTAAG